MKHINVMIEAMVLLSWGNASNSLFRTFRQRALINPDMLYEYIENTV